MNVEKKTFKNKENLINFLNNNMDYNFDKDNFKKDYIERESLNIKIIENIEKKIYNFMLFFNDYYIYTEDKNFKVDKDFKKVKIYN